MLQCGFGWGSSIVQKGHNIVNLPNIHSGYSWSYLWSCERYDLNGFTRNQYELDLCTQIGSGRGTKCYLNNQRGWQVTGKIFKASKIPVLKLALCKASSCWTQVWQVRSNSGYHNSSYDNYISEPQFETVPDFTSKSMQVRIQAPDHNLDLYLYCSWSWTCEVEIIISLLFLLQLFTVNM